MEGGDRGPEGKAKKPAHCAVSPGSHGVVLSSGVVGIQVGVPGQSVWLLGRGTSTGDGTGDWLASEETEHSSDGGGHGDLN